MNEENGAGGRRYSLTPEEQGYFRRHMQEVRRLETESERRRTELVRAQQFYQQAQSELLAANAAVQAGLQMIADQHDLVARRGFRLTEDLTMLVEVTG